MNTMILTVSIISPPNVLTINSHVLAVNGENPQQLWPRDRKTSPSFLLLSNYRTA